MSYIAYFIGGPMDLTKRVMQGTYPERRLGVQTVEPMFLSPAKGFEEVACHVHEDVYELCGRGHYRYGESVVYIFEFCPHREEQARRL